MTKRMTHEEFIDKCKTNLEYFEEYTILNKFVSSREKIIVRHVCGNEYSVKASHFLHDRSKCPLCSKGRNGSKTLSLKEFTDMIVNNYILESEYHGLTTKVILKCKKCENSFSIIPSDLINRNKKCPYCYGNKKSTLEALNSRVKEIDREYILDEDKNKSISFKNVHTPIFFYHIKCKRTFLKSFNNFRNGQRCPFCNAENAKSKACLELIDYFKLNNIRYEEEVELEGLEYKRPLRIDFYLPDYDIYLEYDGKQHFVYENSGIFTEDTFNTIKLRDEIKNEYFKKNELVLYRINYLEDHIKMISEILEKCSTTIETMNDDNHTKRSRVEP